MGLKENLERIQELTRQAELGGGEDRLKRQRENGRMTARERVSFLLDRDSFVGAKLSASGDAGLVEGQGNADMKMSFIDPTTNAPAGETVVTSGFHDPNGVESIYPPGLVIGAISSSLPASNQLEKTLTVRPAADFSQLDIVLVLLTHRGSVAP